MEFIIGVLLILIALSIIFALSIYSLIQVMFLGRKRFLLTPISRAKREKGADAVLSGADLSRDMTVTQATMTGVGAMIGAGIFVLTGIAAGIAGPGLLVAFAFNGVVATLIALVYAELGSAIPEAGGGYVWARAGLGELNGFYSGWMSWFAAAVAGSLYSLGFSAYFIEFLGNLGLHLSKTESFILQKLIAVIVIFIFLIINQSGSAVMGKAETWISGIKVLILAFFILIGLTIIFSNPRTSMTNFEDFFPTKEGFFSIFLAMGFTFIGPPPDITVTCSDFCNATLAPVFCGNGICDFGEDEFTCPIDCAPAPPLGVCGDPDYRPAPTGLMIRPVKGERKMRLTFTLLCPADHIKIYRCEGKDCTNFKSLGTFAPVSFFIDEDPGLKWKQDYTYKIVARYVGYSKDSDEAVGVGNLGDIECWGQELSEFCIADYYYIAFKDYLNVFGYGPYPADDFTTFFAKTVNDAFGTRFNQAWACNDENKLFKVGVTCDEDKGEFCVADEHGSRCAELEDCAIGFNPFGLYGTQASCEGGLTPRFCFFDRSETVVNKCFSCRPRMVCYDYHSKGACQRDNCGVGDCEWHSIIPGLGIGVCVDNRYNNCPFCNIIIHLRLFGHHSF